MTTQRARIVVVGIVSLAMGFLHVFPQLLFIRELGKDYWGFLLLGSPDKEFYLSLVREALDGHWLLASPFLYEHKDAGLCAFPFFGVWLAALPGLLGLSISAVTIFWDFAAPAGATALCYWAYRRAGLTTTKAIAAAVAAIAAPYLLALEPATLAALSTARRAHGFYFFLPMLRTINPQQSVLVYLPAVAILFGIMSKGEKIAVPARYFIIAGILMFLLSLTNLYFSTFLITAASIWGLMLVMRRDTRTRGVGLIACALAGVAGLGFIGFNLIQLKRHLGALHTINVLHTHAPMIGSGEIMLIVFAVGIYLMRRWRKGAAHTGRMTSSAPTVLLPLTMAAAFLICMNQQVVTGVLLQSWHYELYVVPFLLPLSFFLFIEALGEKLKPGAVFAKIGNVSLVLFVLICLGDGIVEQWWGYKNTHQTYARASRVFRGPFEWLAANAPKDAVVMADPLNTARFIPVYTSQNVLASIAASEFPVPSPDEMAERLTWNLAEMSVSLQDFADMVLPDEAPFHFAFFSRRRNDPSTARTDADKLLPPITDGERKAALQKYVSADNSPSPIPPFRLDFCLRGYYENRGYGEAWKVASVCLPVAKTGDWLVCKIVRQ